MWLLLFVMIYTAYSFWSGRRLKRAIAAVAPNHPLLGVRIGTARTRWPQGDDLKPPEVGRLILEQRRRQLIAAATFAGVSICYLVWAYGMAPDEPAGPFSTQAIEP